MITASFENLLILLAKGFVIQGVGELPSSLKAYPYFYDCFSCYC